MLHGTLGRLPQFGADASTGLATKGSLLGQKVALANAQRSAPSASFPRQTGAQTRALAALAAVSELDAATRGLASRRAAQAPELQQVLPVLEGGSGCLPAALYRLLDPAAPVELPPPGSVAALREGANRELDKLVAALGRSKATWRRALALHEWLLQAGHRIDDRLGTTLIRVCAQHGQATTALSLYDWMRAPAAEGGAGLTPTVFTYTAAMRAALTGGALDRALAVWDNALAAGCDVDCRLCTTLIEVCGRKGDTDRALAAYAQMRDAPRGSRMAPSVHAYTAAMRAAAEGGRWEAALAVWEDMRGAGCKPTGHAYAAVISACAAGGQWQKAVALFDEMLAWGVRPDVVSCTALITALGTDGQWERAEKVVEWMLRSDIRPNVRTYTALITALGNAKQWDRAMAVVRRMRGQSLGSGLEPNAYTYSALLKTMGEQGRWQLAERFFSELEAEQLQMMAREAMAAEGGAARRAGAGAAASTAAAAAAAAAPAVSAFPGMAKQLPTEMLPGGDRPAGSNPAAIAAAAAAVAAMAAEHQRQQQLAAAAAAAAEAEAASVEGDSEGEGLQAVASSAAEQVLGTPRAGSAAADADAQALAAAVQAAQPPADSSAQAPAFSYFSGAGKAGAAVDAAAAPATDGGSPSSVAEAAAALAALSFGLPAEGAREVAGAAAGAWTSDNAAVRGLAFHLDELSAGPLPPAAADTAAVANVLPAPGLKLRPLPRGRGPVNEVVCGALMLAYERAGKWQEAVAVLDRARALGIQPNTIMCNTAISALGKALRVDDAEALFKQMAAPDAVSYETMIAAYGMSGVTDKAEATFSAMRAAGWTPRDYAYCGLIAAHSFKGDWQSALRVKERMAAVGAAPTVHVYNAIIAACDRAHQYERALRVAKEMRDADVPGNGVTQSLLDGVCKEGVRAVESQQAAAAALSAAVAAAGTIMIRAGLF